MFWENGTLGMSVSTLRLLFRNLRQLRSLPVLSRAVLLPSADYRRRPFPRSGPLRANTDSAAAARKDCRVSEEASAQPFAVRLGANEHSQAESIPLSLRRVPKSLASLAFPEPADWLVFACPKKAWTVVPRDGEEHRHRHRFWRSTVRWALWARKEEEEGMEVKRTTLPTTTNGEARAWHAACFGHI
ncbi:hypothetical protein HPB51_007199 [Rhipicephalus microplus]|uniref:Uncharacterized protein n=1 Tax=Rhipicephalus microplus TaxID=6941 RepID=A0A9J6E0M6_RHIMP|nr:hypothetical protein HPB51_007199 [Rhipicephalus microplus]